MGQPLGLVYASRSRPFRGGLLLLALSGALRPKIANDAAGQSSELTEDMCFSSPYVYGKREKKKNMDEMLATQTSADERRKPIRISAKAMKEAKQRLEAAEKKDTTQQLHEGLSRYFENPQEVKWGEIPLRASTDQEKVNTVANQLRLFQEKNPAFKVIPMGQSIGYGVLPESHGQAACVIFMESQHPQVWKVWKGLKDHLKAWRKGMNYEPLRMFEGHPSRAWLWLSEEDDFSGAPQLTTLASTVSSGISEMMNKLHPKK